MKLLSIGGVYHDLNISYYDGQKVHYVKVERLNQIKHYSDTELFDLTNDFTSYIKKYLNIDVTEVDAICLESAVLKSNKLDVSLLWENLYYKYSNKIFIVDHHYLHALSARIFLNKSDLDIVIDGQGGRYSWTVFKDNKRIDYAIADKNGSIGYGMSLLAPQLGLKGHILDLPGKLMGLQSYGSLDNNYLEYLSKYNVYNIGATVTRTDTGKTHRLGMYDLSTYSGPNKLDAAKTLHYKSGLLVDSIFKKHAKETDTITYSGGVAQNVIWNTNLKLQYKNLHILPHVGDEGLSIGGLEFLRQYFNLPPFSYQDFPYIQSDAKAITTEKTTEIAANYLAQGKIVAWYSGNGEVGPRALGNRSILMDPRITNAKDTINKVKNREEFRPFGASILAEYAKDYFDMDFDNPYMLYVGKTVKPGLEAITHVDGTCRVQTVHSGVFRLLLEKFYEITGCPVLLNTSLNVSGKPIAGSFEDAILEFNSTPIDVLIIGDNIYT